MDQRLKAILDVFNPWWNGKKIDTGIERAHYNDSILSSIKDPRVTFVLGARRVGKTILLFQTIYHLVGSGVKPESILFLSLDNSNLHDIDLLELISHEQYEYVFLDEIYYMKNWENILKSLYDIPGRSFHIICSGSSAGAINSKKHFLTGRSTHIYVHPLDFREFQLFARTKGYDISVTSYLEYGGYPEYVLGRHPGYHSELLNDVVEKDIVTHFHIRRTLPIKELLMVIGKQIGFKTSIHKLSKVLQLSDDTVKSYLEHLEQSRIVSCVYKYSPSINDRVYSAKKYYFEDTGVRNNITGFEDLGSLAENTVFSHLKRNQNESEIFYHSDSTHSEIDFMIVQNKMIQLIEVKYVSTVEGVLNRLSDTFVKDIDGYAVNHRVVVTNGITENINFKGYPIELVSLEEFLSKS